MLVLKSETHSPSLVVCGCVLKMAAIREDRVVRFKAMELVETPSYAEHVNALGMILSLLGLLMKVSLDEEQFYLNFIIHS